MKDWLFLPLLLGIAVLGYDAISKQYGLFGNDSQKAYNDIVEEIVANSCGEVLMNNQYLAELVAQNRSLAEKVRDWLSSIIDSLFNGSNGGYQEALYMRPFLEGLQERFNAALESVAENKNAQKNSTQRGTKKYSLDKYTEHQKENWSSSKKIVIYNNDSQLIDFVNSALENGNSDKKMYFGTIGKALANRIALDTGYDFEKRNVTLRQGNIRKVNKDHGNNKKESPRGQRSVTPTDYTRIPDIISSPDSITAESYKGKNAAVFMKVYGNERYNLFMVDIGGSLDLIVQTFYINQKKGGIAYLADANAPTHTSETPIGTTPTNSLSDHEGKINKKNQQIRAKSYLWLHQSKKPRR